MILVAVYLAMGKQNNPHMRIARPASDNTRRNLPHLQCAGKTYFVTFSTYKRWVLPESVRSIIIEHCLHDHGLKIFLHGVVVMPDHVHMVITPLTDEQGGTFGLAEILQGIKGGSARNINKTLGRMGKVWQRESFDRMLRSFENARSKVEYICQNPIRKGLVANEDDYPWLWREWKDSALR